MVDYPSNSNRAKKDQKKEVTKVISGNAKVKKKSEIQKVSEVFVSEDVKNVKNYVFGEVIIPAIKTMFAEAVKNGVEMLLWGDAGGPRRNTSTSSRESYRNYNGYYDNNKSTVSRSTARRAGGYEVDEIIVGSRGEANDILDNLDEIIDTYKVASVADLYDLAGLSGRYTDNKWGWYDIKGADVVRDRHGEYVIKMPRPKPID